MIPAGRLLALCALTGLLCSCAVTTLTSRWKDQEYEGALGSLLVVALADSEHHRRVYEDEFVRQLENRGVHAVASYRVLSTPEVPDQATLERAVRSEGLEGILATHLVDVSRETVYHPPMVYEVYPYYYRHWPTFVDYTYSPGYTTEYTTVFLETHLYEAQEGRLIWSGQTETFDPLSPQDVVQSLSGVVVGDLRMSGLLR